MSNHPALIRSSGTGDAEAKRAERIVYPENPRYQRIRFLSVLMDQSILLPNGYRIGLDPLLGLVPVIGDAVGAAISFYIVYQAARLGLPVRVLWRMLGNIGVEAVVGVFPVLGDVFDAAWKANMRNVRLIDRHYRPTMPERSSERITGWIAAILGLSALGLLTFVFFLFRMLAGLISAGV